VSNFSGILDGYLARKAEIGRPAVARWRGSLLGACIRQQWYAAEKVEPSNPFPDNLYRIFERGHAVAEVLNKAGKDALEAGELLEFQEEVPVLLPEFDFSGNVDALVKWPDGRREVWEYKSTTNRGMQYIREVKPRCPSLGLCPHLRARPGRASRGAGHLCRRRRLQVVGVQAGQGVARPRTKSLACATILRQAQTASLAVP
jgi:hypothetical protein